MGLVVNSLNWFWIAIAAVVPGPIGLLVAWPIWRVKEFVLGNLAATAVLFGAAFGFIMREKIELDRLAQRCADAGTYCFPNPTAFTRYAIYAFIALVQVIVVFSISLEVETRMRRRGYAPEWR